MDHRPKLLLSSSTTNPTISTTMNWTSLVYLWFIFKSIFADLTSHQLKSKVVFLDTTILDEVARSYLGSEDGNVTHGIMKYCQLQMAPMTETSHHIYASCQEPKNGTNKTQAHHVVHELKSRAIDLISESFVEGTSCVFLSTCMQIIGL